MHLLNAPVRRRIAARLAPPMFGASLFFLAGLATLVALWSDLPRFPERVLESSAAPFAAAATSDLAADAPLPADSSSATRLQFAVIAALLAVWPLFWIEFLTNLALRPWDRSERSFHLFGFVCCLFPPLRMGARSPDLGRCLWLPGLGWQQANDRLRSELLRHFSIPMLAIAMLILPVLATEFFLKEQVENSPGLRIGLQISTGVIWLAFAAEFIVMISVAEQKLSYCKEHWIDLAIILLPLVSFLRSLRILRATKVAKVARVQQLSKMARVYRLRGLTTKTLRALLLLELVHRAFGNSPEKRLGRLRKQHTRMTRELRELERQMEHLEAQQAATLKQTAPASE